MNGVARWTGLAALVLVAGCAGTSSAATQPAVSTATTATTASAPATPVPTKPAEKATPESAVAFAYYFWDLYNYAYTTNDAAPLAAISDPSCRYCAATVDQIGEISDEGSRVTGFKVEVLTAVAPPGKVTTGTLVTLALKQADGELVRKDGAREKLRGYENTRFYLGAAWDGERWSVHGVDHEKPS